MAEAWKLYGKGTVGAGGRFQRLLTIAFELAGVQASAEHWARKAKSLLESRPGAKSAE